MRIPTPQSRPRFSRNPCTCANWSPKSRKCWQPSGFPRPCLANTEPIDQSSLRARSSAEEHYLDMVGVTGSIPVAPTIFSRFYRVLWNRSGADRQEVVAFQSRFNRKQVPFASLSQKRQNAIGCQRNVGERQRIVPLVVAGGPGAVTHGVPQPERTVLARHAAEKHAYLVGHEVSKALLREAFDPELTAYAAPALFRRSNLFAFVEKQWPIARIVIVVLFLPGH